MQTAKDNSRTPERYDYRLIFSKTGSARFISHLDMMRTMQRIFRRAKLPVWYTQGYNPRAYLMFPLPLPLGMESDMEILDLSLTENPEYEDVPERINAYAPEGLRFIKAYKPIMKPDEIASAGYEILLASDDSSENLKAQFCDFLSLDRIEIRKRAKSKRKGKQPGFKIVDIKPYLETSGAVCETIGDKLKITITLPCGTGFNLNASVMTDAFCERYDITDCEIYIKRTKIMCENGEIFT